MPFDDSAPSGLAYFLMFVVPVGGWSILLILYLYDRATRKNWLDAEVTPHWRYQQHKTKRKRRVIAITYRPPFDKAWLKFKRDQF